MAGLFLFWLVGEYDWQNDSVTATRPVRESIASTSTNAELRDAAVIDPELYTISTSQDTAPVAPEDTTRVVIADEIVTEKVAPNPRVVLPTVTLFNGCGVKGVGSRAKAALEKMGFTVIEVRNAANFEYTTSEVLDRRENLRAGKLLADSLGIATKLAAWDTTRSDRTADVSLIVGADYRKLRWKL